MWGGVLLFCRDAICVFYSSSQLGCYSYEYKICLPVLLYPFFFFFFFFLINQSINEMIKIQYCHKDKKFLPNQRESPAYHYDSRNPNQIQKTSSCIIIQHFPFLLMGMQISDASRALFLMDTVLSMEIPNLALKGGGTHKENEFDFFGFCKLLVLHSSDG